MGFDGPSISPGRSNSTIAPFSFPLYCSKSSSFSNAHANHRPRTGPFVLGDHPAAASVNICSVGAITRPVAGPRVQLFAIVHGSRCAFASPSALNCSSVQWLA